MTTLINHPQQAFNERANRALERFDVGEDGREEGDGDEEEGAKLAPLERIDGDQPTEPAQLDRRP